MSREVYRWSCGCGHTGTGETAAQRHAQTCTLMGRPKRWNGAEPPGRSLTEQRYTLTRAGWVRAICDAAEDYDWECPVTVYPPASVAQERGVRHHRAERCGELVDAEGLCERHLADKRRLT